MKRLSFILLVLCFKNSFSQNKVGYNYDNNGNRIQRTFVGYRVSGGQGNNPSDSAHHNSTQPGNPIGRDQQTLAAQSSVNVYPNPTRDLITINILRKAEKQIKEAELILFDNSGRALGRKKYSGEELYFDLSTNPSGDYYLKITFNDNSTLSYKIVKVN